MNDEYQIKMFTYDQSDILCTHETTKAGSIRRHLCEFQFHMRFNKNFFQDYTTRIHFTELTEETDSSETSNEDSI